MSDNDRNKINVEILQDGPLIVKGLKILRDSQGKQVEVDDVIALCRCGESSNKPFCDGTHKKVGFSGNRQIDKPIDKEREYEGKELSVFDNRVICSHAKECASNLPSVFRLGERPWIAPDNASAEEVISTIRKCLSGALSYSIDGEHIRDFGQSPEIHIAKDGPYNVEGFIQINIEDDMQPPSKEHFALCRCGASKNKPYCDGTHKEVIFKDEDN